MVAASSSRALDIRMNGELVGKWYFTRSDAAVFEYDITWRESPRTRPLSLSLPFLPGNDAHRGGHVAAWFDNLLPESREIRERIGARFHTPSLQPFDLLAAIGRDCVGAVQIMPSGADPGDVHRIDGEDLDDAGVARLLRETTASPFFRQDEASELRISVAGAQEKTALLRIGDHWLRPLGPTPTTHILKLPLGLIGPLRADMQESVENEWLCIHILRALGMPVPEVEIAQFRGELGEVKALVVKRFDRMLIDDDPKSPWIARLPQEDFCQVTGTPAHLKYESEKGGGPGISRILPLLLAGNQPEYDAITFAKAQLAFWLLAAPDGHAKNFSIFLKRDGYVMTPIYDVLSAWPIIGKGPNEWPYQEAKLAMAVRGTRPRRLLSQISVRHWQKLAAQTGALSAFNEMVSMVERTEEALQAVHGLLPSSFPEQLWSRVSKGVLWHRERFLYVLSHSKMDAPEPEPAP